MSCSPWKEKVYEISPKLPSFILDASAFVTELMGVTFYCHLDKLFNDVFADEPEVHERLKAMLDEITIDEAAHVGQRRKFIGSIGIKVFKWLVKPFYTMFFNDIPEVGLLFDVEQMIKDDKEFDFNQLLQRIVQHSWMPSYCKA